MIGTDYQPICVPGDATITILGKMSKINNKRSYILETAAHVNLPSGIVVNCHYDTPKSGRMSVVLVNTTSKNIWIIRQPLLAADICEVELHPWQYHANLNREGNDITINFQLAIPPEIEQSIQSNHLEAEGKSANPEVQENPQPTFGPHPDMSLNYNFEDEVQQLPFKFNLGDVPFNKKQKDQLLNLIYDHKEVFSLHNKDPGFCDKLAHTIMTTTDKPVYLPHRTIDKQLQGEVRK